MRKMGGDQSVKTAWTSGSTLPHGIPEPLPAGQQVHVDLRAVGAAVRTAIDPPDHQACQSPPLDDIALSHGGATERMRAELAAQGVDLRSPHQTSQRLQPVMQSIRADVEHYHLDHYFAPDIVAVAKQITSGAIAGFCPLHFASEGTA